MGNSAEYLTELYINQLEQMADPFRPRRRLQRRWLRRVSQIGFQTTSSIEARYSRSPKDHGEVGVTSTKPTQKLRRDLKEAVALLKRSGVDLIQAAVKLSESGQEDDAKELVMIAMRFQEVEDLMAGYADEVKTGRLQRKSESI